MHIFWILVELPSPQKLGPIVSQAVGRVPRPPKISASHDMYLRFDLLFPDGQTARQCTQLHRISQFIFTKRRQIISKLGVPANHFLVITLPTPSVSTTTKVGTYFMRPATRGKNQNPGKRSSTTTKKDDEIVQESSTTVRRSKSGFSPSLALPTGENPPGRFFQRARCLTRLRVVPLVSFLTDFLLIFD